MICILSILQFFCLFACLFFKLLLSSLLFFFLHTLQWTSRQSPVVSSVRLSFITVRLSFWSFITVRLSFLSFITAKLSFLSFTVVGWFRKQWRLLTVHSGLRQQFCFCLTFSGNVHIVSPCLLESSPVSAGTCAHCNRHRVRLGQCTVGRLLTLSGTGYCTVLVAPEELRSHRICFRMSCVFVCHVFSYVMCFLLSCHWCTSLDLQQ